MKSHSHAPIRISVNHVAFDHDMPAANGNPQRKCRANWKRRLRAHVEPAHAYIFCAGDAGRLDAFEVHVNYQARPIMLAALLA